MHACGLSFPSETMGRYTGPVCRLCRREGVKLFLKSLRCDSPKCAIERREGSPGMHGEKKSKPTEYGKRLREKQKVKRYYGLYERQFKRLLGIAERSTGNTADMLMSLLERRLDNIVHRLGFAGSRQNEIGRALRLRRNAQLRPVPNEHQSSVSRRSKSRSRGRAVVVRARSPGFRVLVC